MKNLTHIDNRKGYRPAVTGAPASTATAAPEPATVALLPTAIPFIKPRLKVREGDRVKIGTPLIEDKRNPAVRFLSPGGGTVAAVRYGARRAIEEIIIERDAEEELAAFPHFPQEQLVNLSRAELVQALLDGGAWPLLRELPCRDYPRLENVPPAIFVVLGNDEPFHPDPTCYLAGEEALFAYGLQALGRLTDGPVQVAVARENSELKTRLGDAATLTWSGPYPAGDPGTLLYRLKNAADENRCWYIDGQDLLQLAALLRDGRYRVEQTICVAGPGAPAPQHLRTRRGAPLADLAGDAPEDLRYIHGGLLTGFSSPAATHLSPAADALNLAPEGDSKGEPFELFLPGYRKPTYSRAFLSALNPAPLPNDCNQHGGDRACIACGYCTRVCAVEILPQFTYKELHADALEEALAHGLLDCVECGLCSYVCPAKIELMEAFKAAKADYLREQDRHETA